MPDMSLDELYELFGLPPLRVTPAIDPEDRKVMVEVLFAWEVEERRQLRESKKVIPMC